MKKLILFLLLASPLLAAPIFFPAMIAPASGGGGAPSPVGWWKLNDASGTSAVDASGNGNTGTLNGTNPGLPTWGTGPNGNGDIVFSSVNVDQKIDLGNSASVQPTAAGTFSAWVKFTGSIGAYECIVGNNNFGPELNGCALVTYPGIDFLFEIADGSTAKKAVGLTDATPGQWYHVVGTWDGTTVHLYVNGVEDTTGGAGTPQGGITPTPGQNTLIGNNVTASGWKSEIDDVIIYNVALTAAQVLALYNAGAQ